MSAVELSRGFRQFQTHSTLLAEKERVVQLKRQSIVELRLQIANLGEDCRRRQVEIATDTEKYCQKKSEQDAKWGVKEAHNRAQHDQLAALKEQEEELQQAILLCEGNIATAQSELETRRKEAEKLSDLQGRLTQMKYDLEDRDAKVMMLETRAAKMELATTKRYMEVARQAPQYALPQVEFDSARGGLEDLAGESILLVDDQA